MRQLITAFLIIWCILAVGQPDKEQTVLQRLDIIEQHLGEQETVQQRLSSIEREMQLTDSIQKALKEQLATLKTQNDILSTALEASGTIFDGVSTYFTIVSILLSIIVVAVPVVNYFLVLKPNRETISKLEHLETEIPRKIEADFGIYLAGFEKRKVKQLINFLDEPDKLRDLLNFLFLSTYDDFDEEDQIKMIAYLEKEHETEDIDRRILNKVLSYKPSPISENYYRRVLEVGNQHPDYQFALEYLIDNTPEKFLPFWEMVIPASPSGHEILLDVFAYLRETYLGNDLDTKMYEKRSFGEATVKLFFNSRKICDAIALKEELPYQRKMEMNMNVVTRYEFLKDTLYINTYYDNQSGNLKNKKQ